MPLPGWAVAVTRPNSEAKAVSNVIKLGYAVFYPKLIRRKRFLGKRIQIMCPLFPRYFFVFIEHMWTGLVEAQGMVGLLMIDEQLATVRKDVMQTLKSRCDRNGIYVPKPKKRFASGQKVKPQLGLFMDKVGMFDGVVGEREAALFEILGARRRILFDEGILVAV